MDDSSLSPESARSIGEINIPRVVIGDIPRVEGACIPAVGMFGSACGEPRRKLGHLTPRVIDGSIFVTTVGRESRGMGNLGAIACVSSSMSETRVGN